MPVCAHFTTILQNELTGSMRLSNLQSGNEDRGVCGLPFTRQLDNQTVYIPMNIIGNLYVSNGMSVGNTRNEARVQGLSEVFEAMCSTASSLQKRRPLLRFSRGDGALSGGNGVNRHAGSRGFPDFRLHRLAGRHPLRLRRAVQPG